MTSKQPTEPGWDANGSPVVDTADYRAEYGELCEWAANERRLQLMLAKPVPYLPGDKL